MALIIGDSTVKHIDEKKISRAERGKSTCHSYSGAKIKDIHQKFQQSSYNDEYVTIILHVGTNDLANDGADEFAERMENLIVDVKNRAKRVGISSVIKRYDGRVSFSKIAYYNTLTYKLCVKHNVSYIDNDHITKNLLNGSNLHLNKLGDKTLGNTFCTFVKSVRINHEAAIPATNRQPFFQKAAKWTKEWTNYLRFVKEQLSM